MEQVTDGAVQVVFKIEKEEVNVINFTLTSFR
jgi:hypothetical protein